MEVGVDFQGSALDVRRATIILTETDKSAGRAGLGEKMSSGLVSED